MFPLYAADEGIAGAAGKRPAAAPIDAEAFFKRGEPCPLCGCSCDCQRSTDGTAPPGKKVCPACGCICDEAGPCACKPHLVARSPLPPGEGEGEGSMGKSPLAQSASPQPSPKGRGGEGARDDLDDLIDQLDQLDV